MDEHRIARVEVDFHMKADAAHTYALQTDVRSITPLAVGDRVLASDGEVTHWARVDAIDGARGTLLLRVLWDEATAAADPAVESPATRIRAV